MQREKDVCAHSAKDLTRRNRTNKILTLIFVIMKKIKFLAMMLAAGMFAACSDSLEETTGGNGSPNAPEVTEGYVKVSINMPTTSGAMTRADDVTLDDGTDKEYAVNDGILVFFKTTATTGKGTPEETATFVKAYNVTLENAGEGNAEVTTRRTVINEAPMAGKNEKMYVLAILNRNGLFSVKEDEDGTLQVNNAPVFTNDYTLKALQKALTTTAEDITKNGFLMLNAPLAKTTTIADITDLSSVQTLVPVTVYESEEKAQNGDIANIYVERVVAKVTVTGFTYADGKYTADVAKDDKESPFNGDKVQLQGWTLSVTNTSTKAVRDISGLPTWLTSDYMTNDKLRFLSTTKIDNKELYRIYWGIDGNYTSTDNYTNAFNILSEDNTGTWNWQTNTNDLNAPNEASNPLYCLENTMNYDMMDQNKTTTLFIKTTYFADPEHPDNAQDFFMYGTLEETFLTADFLAKVKEALSLDEDITISLNQAATGGTYTYIPVGEEDESSLTQKDITDLFTLSGGTSLSDEQAKSLAEKLGNIKFYQDGATYYNSVLIRHFDETEYPDVAWDPTAPEYTEKQLGRYGVLRNNWYEINVTSFSGPGDPEIQDPDDGPDDNKEGYIRAQINVLSWAKRSQDVDL